MILTGSPQKRVPAAKVRTHYPTKTYRGKAPSSQSVQSRQPLGVEVEHVEETRPLRRSSRPKTRQAVLQEKGKTAAEPGEISENVSYDTVSRLTHE